MTSATCRAIGFIALLTSQACVKDYRNGRPDLVQPTKGGGNKDAPRRGYATGFGSKPVQWKTPPTRLIAQDGTSCVVSKEKFDSATVGTSVWCTWFDADR
jgi:hypothetical protein